MCGRYTVTADLDELVEVFDAPPLDGLELDLPRFNIAPTQDAPVVAVGREGRRIAAFRWGLVPHWAGDPSIGNRLINARSETAHEKPAFRDAFAGKRCLVVADGFYEWQRPQSGRGPKQPYWIHDPDERPFAMAGLWEKWGRGDEPLLSFTILTTRASESLEPIHERMPVLLPEKSWEAWLDRTTDARELKRWLSPAPDDALEARPVSTLVNSPENDTPACVEGV